MDSRSIILLIVLIAVAIGAAWWYTGALHVSIPPVPAVPEAPAAPAPDGKTVTFACDGSRTITATFYPQNDTHVDLELSDGRKLSVPHAISASGARYANADESFVFWNKGNTAFITENGTTTYANCALPL
jgi:membrane-bound inhibitor of C-type lysozyme